MAFSKHSRYSSKDQAPSHFARALGHSARIKILRTLSQNGPLCVQALAEGHAISKSAMSYHLKILRKAQLVDWYEQYPFTFYMVNEKNMAIAQKELASFFEECQLMGTKSNN